MCQMSEKCMNEDYQRMLLDLEQSKIEEKEEKIRAIKDREERRISYAELLEEAKNKIPW